MPDVYFNKNKNQKNSSRQPQSRNGRPVSRQQRPAQRQAQQRPAQRPVQQRPAQQRPVRRPPADYNEYPEYNDYSQYKAPKKKRTNRTQPVQQPPRRKKKKGCFGRSLTSFILIFAILYTGLAFVIFGGLKVDHSITPPSATDLTLKRSPFVYNILLVGDDSREEAKMERADTMIIVSIDNLHRKIKLTSLLRDSYVAIPGHGFTKLNAATAYGGIPLLIKTIEYNYGININRYMSVNFSAFTDLIDALGGVDVPVTQKEATYLNNTWHKWSLTGNPVHYDYGDRIHLDGEKALMFVRIRKLDSDVQRTRRQRLVISAIKEKLSEASPLDLLSIPYKVMPNITTSCGRVKMLNLSIKALLLYRHYEIVSASCPFDGTWSDKMINGAEVVYFDTAEVSRDLKRFIYRDETIS